MRIRPIFKSIERGVYYLLNHGELVYIGRSNNVFLRIGTHAAKKEIPFDSWWWEPVEGEADQWLLEGEMIAAHQPRFNKTSYSHNFSRVWESMKI